MFVSERKATHTLKSENIYYQILEIISPAFHEVVYPLQYSWACLVAQLVKNPPAMWETWVLFPGWEDALEKGKATHSSILAWRIPWTKSMGSQRVGHD